MRGVCVKCRNCMIPMAGTCPIMHCAKGLINGPCGGAQNGKCEIDGVKDCVWCMVIPKVQNRRISITQILNQIKDYSVVRTNGF
ncbi:hypothetical protein JDF658_11840 [Carboxydocella sp. JDF658]|nr:hypothetical protein ULO1_22590 [Carboxydocella sp. ULO1]GAW31419.1 hypothetical protein JDF658_11840 [Carboxydocella sp. JDF658]